MTIYWDVVLGAWGIMLTFITILLPFILVSLVVSRFADKKRRGF